MSCSIRSDQLTKWRNNRLLTIWNRSCQQRFIFTKWKSCIGKTREWLLSVSDLKPENILFDSKKEDSTIKIIDFGASAKIIDRLSKKIGTVRLSLKNYFKMSLFMWLRKSWSVIIMKNATSGPSGSFCTSFYAGTHRSSGTRKSRPFRRWRKATTRSMWTTGPKYLARRRTWSEECWSTTRASGFQRRTLTTTLGSSRITSREGSWTRTPCRSWVNSKWKTSWKWRFLSSSPCK